MAYLEVPDSDLDADSPLTETVMIQLNDNIKSNKASEVTGGDTHDHAGGDGNPIITAGLADAAVTEAKSGIRYRFDEVPRIDGELRTGNIGHSSGTPDPIPIQLSGDGSKSDGSGADGRWTLLDVDIVGGIAYIGSIITQYTRPDLGEIFKTKIKTDSDVTEIRHWYGWTSNSTVNDSDSTPDVEGSLFRYATDVDGTAFWRCLTINGTGASAEVTTTTVAFTADTVYDLEIRMTATEHTFYIDGNLVATHNTTVPTSTTEMEIMLGVTSLSNTGPRRGTYVGEISIIKEKN